MPAFENYAREAADIEREIARKGLILGIDWDDETQVRALAREALACKQENANCLPNDPQALARIELFGLAQLMLTVMRQSAEDDLHTHGGPIWKTFARALWRETESGRNP